MAGDDRHIAFIDILGLRSALGTGRLDAAESKTLELARVVESAVEKFPAVAAHGATDFFLLWAVDPAAGWQLAQAAAFVFQQYFVLNERNRVSDLAAAYLVRGGLAYGQVRETSAARERLSYSLTLGDGVARAYETQAVGTGMRLFLDDRATREFKPNPDPSGHIDPIKVDKTHDFSGAISTREVRWVGCSEYAERHLFLARGLFRRSLVAYRRGEIDEHVVLHYQQTLCSVLRGVSSVELLVPLLAYRSNSRYRSFYYPVWATAWLRLFRPKNEEAIRELREVLWENFLKISATDGILHVTKSLRLYSRWRPLIRFLRKGELRIGPRRRR